MRHRMNSDLLLVHIDEEVLLTPELELELLRSDVDDLSLLGIVLLGLLHGKVGCNYSPTRRRILRLRIVDQQIGGLVRERYVCRNRICISDIDGEM